MPHWRLYPEPRSELAGGRTITGLGVRSLDSSHKCFVFSRGEYVEPGVQLLELGLGVAFPIREDDIATAAAIQWLDQPAAEVPNRPLDFEQVRSKYFHELSDDLAGK